MRMQTHKKEIHINKCSHQINRKVLNKQPHLEDLEQSKSKISRRKKNNKDQNINK
jgi:hypothetical protein